MGPPPCPASATGGRGPSLRSHHRNRLGAESDHFALHFDSGFPAGHPQRAATHLHLERGRGPEGGVYPGASPDLRCHGGTQCDHDFKPDGDPKFRGDPKSDAESQSKPDGDAQSIG